jgi:hypothetical protein
MDWKKILSDGGVPEPPGREEVLAQIKAEPYVPHKHKAKRTKPESKRKR